MKNNSDFNEAESIRQIKRGAIMSYIAMVVNVLAGLLHTPWMIQQIVISLILQFSLVKREA